MVRVVTLLEGGGTIPLEEMLEAVRAGSRPAEAAVSGAAARQHGFNGSSVLAMVAAGSFFQDDSDPDPSLLPRQEEIDALPVHPGEPPPTQAELMAACAQVRHASDPVNQPNVPEPAWWCVGAGTLSYTREGNEAVHRASERHPEYNRDDTEEKIKRWQNNATGPATCGKIGEVCGPERCIGCGHAGNPKSSPIVAARKLARERQGASAHGSIAGQANATPTPVALPCIAASAFAERSLPERPWLVRDMIPGRQVTLLGGDGGVGKSLIALQLAVAVATATPWLGTMPTSGPVLYLSAEDDESELHRRLAAIVAGGDGLSLGGLSNLHIVPLAGSDAVLGTVAPKAEIIVPTPLWQAVVTQVAAIRPRLVIIDNLADAFAGNENSRPQARQFVNLLRGLAIAHDLAVVVLGHPSLQGMSTGTGTSGSTAWNNSVRSRLYLDRIRIEDSKGKSGIEPDPELRVLRTMKANYSATGAEVRMRWDAGRFKLDGGGVGAVDRMAAEQRAERVFLATLRLLQSQGRDVSPNKSNTYAPAVFAQHPDAEGITSHAFARAMERLLALGLIAVERTGTEKRPRARIVTVG